MNEKNKMIAILIFLTGILISFGIIYIVSYKESKSELYKFYKAFNSEEKNLVVIGRKTCHYCLIQMPIIKDLDYQYNFGYTYIDTDKISNTQLGEILRALNADTENFGTPYSAIVQNKEKIAEYDGAATEDIYLNFLKENEIIKTNEPNPITFLSDEEYTNFLTEAKQKTFVVVTNSSLEGYSDLMKYLRNIKAEYGVTVNFINTLAFGQENYLSFAESELPAIIAFDENGNKNVKSENKTYDDYITFLKNNGIIK